MSIDPERVRVFSDSNNEDVVRMLQKVTSNSKKFCDIYGNTVDIVEAKCYRLGSKNCPVKIDWRPRFKKSSKYETRNLPFQQKG